MIAESASSKARDRRGLGFPALDQEPQADSSHARGVLRPEEHGRRSAALLTKDEARRIAANIASCRSWCVTSTARAKSAIGRLDFNLTIVLSAGGEPECAARSLNNRGASAFAWIIRKLVEPNL